MGRQEDACWRCGARVRHVHLSGRQAHDALPPRRLCASRAVVARAVHEAGRADPLPSRAEDHARWRAERLDAKRRQKQQMRELAAAIDAGDAAYRRLRDRLDDFSIRLAAVRRTLVTTPAGRPVGHASKHETEAASTSRRSSRQSQVMSLRVADGVAI